MRNEWKMNGFQFRTETNSTYEVNCLQAKEVNFANYSISDIEHCNHQENASVVIFSASILLAALSKYLYYKIEHRLQSIIHIPESCFLTCVGFLLGYLTVLFQKDDSVSHILEPVSRIQIFEFMSMIDIVHLSPFTFFMVILPPIVFEAAYFIPKIHFFENLGTILVYAIPGTIFNALAVGLMLNWLDLIADVPISIWLLFGTILSAVDPVAVVAAFDELHVNFVLYMCVFGESLLNDGVAVAMFHVFKRGLQDFSWLGICKIIGNITSVAFGGVLIGFFIGILVALVSKHSSTVRLFEPLLMIALSYLAYIIAELLGFSAILSVVSCAFVMKEYVEHNIIRESRDTLKYVIKSMSMIFEILICVLLGQQFIVMLWQPNFDEFFDARLVGWTIFLVTIVRFIGIYSLTFLVNFTRRKSDQITKLEQFILSYGGLRGAIAYCLMQTSTPYLSSYPLLQEKLQFTTILVVLFTTFIQGSTIGILVRLFKIGLQDEDTNHIEQDMCTEEIEHLTFAEKIHHLAYYQMIHGINSILHDDLQVDWLANIDPVLDLFDDWLLKDFDDCDESTSLFLKNLANQNHLDEEDYDDMMLEEEDEYDEEYIEGSDTDVDSRGNSRVSEQPRVTVTDEKCVVTHFSDDSIVGEDDKSLKYIESDLGEKKRQTKNRQSCHLKHKRIAGSINYNFDHEHFDIKQRLSNMLNRKSGVGQRDSRNRESRKSGSRNENMDVSNRQNSSRYSRNDSRSRPSRNTSKHRKSSKKAQSRLARNTSITSRLSNLPRTGSYLPVRVSYEEGGPDVQNIPIDENLDWLHHDLIDHHINTAKDQKHIWKRKTRNLLDNRRGRITENVNSSVDFAVAAFEQAMAQSSVIEKNFPRETQRNSIFGDFREKNRSESKFRTDSKISRNKFNVVPSASRVSKSNIRLSRSGVNCLDTRASQVLDENSRRLSRIFSDPEAQIQTKNNNNTSKTHPTNSNLQNQQQSNRTSQKPNNRLTISSVSATEDQVNSNSGNENKEKDEDVF